MVHRGTAIGRIAALLAVLFIANTALPATAGRPGPIYWGASLDGVPWEMDKLLAWEQEVAGKHVSIVHFWHFWVQDPAVGLQPFSALPFDNIRGHGAIPLVTWAPEQMGRGQNQPEFALSRITGGAYDEYIRDWATKARDWGHPFFLRWGHEMNGNWFPWSETANGNHPGEFVVAWRHIHDIFTSVGAKNVTWVWCPNVDVPGSARLLDASMYPGHDYVDWTCLDGYNWGPLRAAAWQSFAGMFTRSYATLLRLAPEKPIMLGEYGTVDRGGSAAEWTLDALTRQIPYNFPRIKAQVRYNWLFNGADWRAEASPSIAAALRSGLRAPFYVENIFGNVETSPIPEPVYYP